MYNAREAVSSLIPEGQDHPMRRLKTVYSYIIDTAEYDSSEDDQNVAGDFLEKTGGLCRICREQCSIFWNNWKFPVFT